MSEKIWIGGAFYAIDPDSPERNIARLEAELAALRARYAALENAARDVVKVFDDGFGMDPECYKVKALRDALKGVGK